MSTEIFPNTRLYQFGYCAIFTRDISPIDLLARVVGGPVRPTPVSRTEAEIIVALGEDISEDDLPGLDIDELRSAGLLEGDGPLLRGGTHGEWSFVIESEGPYLANDDVLKAVSQDTAALSVRESESGSSWISYAENGEILSSFDPLFPDSDYGKRPQVLEQLTGHLEAISNGERYDAFPNALRKIQQELHCTVPQEVDAGPLQAVRIAGGY